MPDTVTFKSTLDKKLALYMVATRAIVIFAVFYYGIGLLSTNQMLAQYKLPFVALFVVGSIGATGWELLKMKENRFEISEGKIVSKAHTFAAPVGVFYCIKIANIASIERVTSRKTIFLLILAKIIRMKGLPLSDFQPINKTGKILKIRFTGGVLQKAAKRTYNEFITLDDPDAFCQFIRQHQDFNPAKASEAINQPSQP